MKNCDLCMDLIPLVADGLASRESEDFVEKHILICPECRNYYQDYSRDGLGDYEKMEDERIIKNIKKNLLIRGVILALLGSLVGMFTVNTEYVFYNILLIPLIGGLSYYYLRKKSYLVLVGVFLISSLGNTMVMMVADPSYGLGNIKAGFSMGLIYGALVFIGLVLGLLFVKLTTRKEKLWIRLLSLILASGFLVYVLIFLNGFYGNPISKALAKKNAQAYIEERYPGENLSLDKLAYDFKDGSYYAIYLKEGSVDYRLNLYFDQKSKVRGDNYEEAIGGGFNTYLRLSEAFNEDVLGDLKTVLASDKLFGYFTSSLNSEKLYSEFQLDESYNRKKMAKLMDESFYINIERDQVDFDQLYKDLIEVYNFLEENKLEVKKLSIAISEKDHGESGLEILAANDLSWDKIRDKDYVKSKVEK